MRPNDHDDLRSLGRPCPEFAATDTLPRANQTWIGSIIVAVILMFLYERVVASRGVGSRAAT
jgi:hypothetical protein